MKVKGKHSAKLAQLKEAYEVAVSSLEKRLEAAIANPGGLCGANDEDIERLRVVVSGIEEQAEVSTSSVPPTSSG